MSENISSFKKISLLVGILSVSIGIYTIFLPQTEMGVAVAGSITQGTVCLSLITMHSSLVSA